MENKFSSRILSKYSEVKTDDVEYCGVESEKKAMSEVDMNSSFQSVTRKKLSNQLVLQEIHVSEAADRLCDGRRQDDEIRLQEETDKENNVAGASGMQSKSSNPSDDGVIHTSRNCSDYAKQIDIPYVGNLEDYEIAFEDEIDLMELLKNADENDIATMECVVAEQNDVEREIDEPEHEEHVEPVDAEHVEPEGKKKSIEIDTLPVPPDDWSKIEDGLRLKPTYIEYFANLLMLKEISCVIVSKGYYKNKESFVIRLACCQVGCKRKYTLKQKPQTCEFVLTRNCVPESHEFRMARPVRGPQRDIARAFLVNHLPSEYSAIANSTINDMLLSKGHLQNTISDKTIQQIRHEALELQDFDKDDMLDLLKRKLMERRDFEKKKTDDIFYRRIGLDPFVVSAFTNKEFDCVNFLRSKDENLYLFFDGTGSLVEHAGKTVYYYAGVVQAKINPNDVKEIARLLPVIKFISGEHDTFNVELQLREYKHEYDKRHPNKPFPFKHVTTDFSFALLNAVCHGWNDLKLIVYINLMYKYANGDLSAEELHYFGVVTFLQLCNAHLSKTHSGDIAKYYPCMSSENQAILKEIFTIMINSKNLDELRKTWVLLSTLILSEYVTDELTSALRELALIDTPENDTEALTKESDETRLEEDRLPNDIDMYESMYANSLFYKDFKDRTFKEKFRLKSGQPNAFFSLQYADVFLKKYISILCLWTCLTQDKRSSNSCAESNFNITKNWMSHRQPVIGKTPLKPGRFMNELKIMNKGKADDILRELPRDRCRKRHLVSDENVESTLPKKKKVLDCKNFMDIYNSFPKSPKTPQTVSQLMKAAASRHTPKSSLQKMPQTSSQLAKDTPSVSSETSQNSSQPTKELATTPKSSITANSKAKRGRNLGEDLDLDHEVAIDNPYVEEQWFRRRTHKHSYMNRQTLKTIQEDNSDAKLQKILSKPNNKATGKGCGVVKLRNGLYDDPEIYMKPEVNYVIATEPKSVLFKNDYESIKSIPTASVIKFVLRMLQLEYGHIQFEFDNASSILTPRSTAVVRFQKEIFLGADFKNAQPSLLIINFKKKEITLLTPTSSSSRYDDTIVEDFLIYIEQHNKKYKNKVGAAGWTRRNFDHQVAENGTFSGLFILKFMMQYTSDNDISGTFEANEFRQELLHFILRNSITMTPKCLFCGFRNVSSDAATVTAVQCNICKRWTHLYCANLDDKDVIVATFICVVCNASAVESTPS